MTYTGLRHIVLDQRTDAYFRPLCSVDDCKNAATDMIGRYENGDENQQGEHSKFSGWLYCRDHYVERVRLDSAARDDLTPAPKSQPDTYTLTVYPSCAHCHVRHDPRMACRVLPDGAVLITTNYRA